MTTPAGNCFFNHDNFIEIKAVIVASHQPGGQNSDFPEIVYLIARSWAFSGIAYLVAKILGQGCFCETDTPVTFISFKYQYVVPSKDVVQTLHVPVGLHVDLVYRTCTERH